MDNINERLFEEKLKGRCCSQTIVSLCLEDMGKENEDLVSAMAAFCNGMGRGKICGTLAAAVAVLQVADPDATTNNTQVEFMDWFEDRFGGYDCSELIGDDPVLKQELCPRIVLETYLKLREYIA
ncbi:MAG: C-GCAxxG-C-C family protein [Clostridiales Family XIII bacterium]|jgi:hypothetical protein|nr:C-GCAxxG-C-C family protein [Clostridiales Family XIII bacterium]